MEFCLASELIGLPYYLVWVNNTLKKSLVKPNCLLIDHEFLYTISKLFLVEVLTFPPQPFIKAYKNVLSSTASHTIPWGQCIPAEFYLDAINEFAVELDSILTTVNMDYYKLYVDNVSIFKELRLIRVNREFVETTEDDILKTFKPDHEGYVSPIIYDRLGAVTGRLRVVSGPNVLALKKEYRKSVYISRFGEDGNIFELDYKGIEPRVLYSITQKKDNSFDIYEACKYDLALPKTITRNDVKGVVVSTLYGSRLDHLTTNDNLIFDARRITDKITDYFGSDELKEELIEENELNNRKYIENYYGRKINTSDAANYMLLCYYIQSTAVDVALNGFKKIISANKGNKYIVPIGINHDALYLDIHKEEQGKLEELCIIGSKNLIGFEDYRFYLESKKVA